MQRAADSKHLGIDTSTSPNRARRWISLIVGTAVTVFFVWLIVRRLSLDELARSFVALHFRLLPLALAGLAVGYAARITRWWVMLRGGAPALAWLHTGRIFLLGTAVNNVLPLRAGDVFRMFAFRNQPGLEPSRIGGTLIAERLLDLVALLAIFVIVLPFVPAGHSMGPLTTIASWAAALALLALIGVIALPSFERQVLGRLTGTPWIRSSPLLVESLAAASALVNAITQLGTPRRFAAIVFLSAVAWVFEGSVFFIAAIASGVPGRPLAAFFALAAATLATLFPSSPGYIGTFDFFAMQALIVFGASAGTAALFAITAHLLLWLPTTLAGFACFIWLVLRGGDRETRFRTTNNDPGRKDSRIANV